MLKYIRWFWKYYRGHKRALVILLTFSLVASALYAVQPILIKNVIDILQSGSTKTISMPYINEWIESLTSGEIGGYIVMMILVAVASMIVRMILIGHRAYMNIKLEWEFRQEAFDGVTEKGPDFFNRFKTGDLVTRMTDDVSQKISWFACSGIFRFYEALTLIAFSVVMMLSIHPMLTLWTAGPLPLLIFVYSKSSTRLHKRFDFLQKKISSVSDTMEACFSGVRVIKAYGREKDQSIKFGQVAEERREAEIAAVKTHTIMESLWMYVWQLGIVIILMAGGYYVIEGTLTIGEFVAFDSYVLFLIFPMFDVGNFLVHGLRAAVSIKRLVELEEHSPMIKAGEKPRSVATDAAGRVEFDRVSFTFPGQTQKILDQVSFTVEPGQRIALAGMVGSGKSWAVRLIPRLVDPVEGRLMLDGVDLKDYDLGDLRRLIGYVPQEPILFSDTVENNVRFNREWVTSDTLDWAIEVSQLRDELESFPKGLATRIGVRGVSISGGQKQRLALARALAGKPKILVLDDCTSALDADTEAVLWNRLHEVMPDLTCFIVTHRPATLELTDKIIVLDEGKIVESGTHLDLILQEGLYCKLYHRIMLEEAVGGET